MSEISRRAGVGGATLYRRFPTKEVLIEEAFADRVTACVDAVIDASRDADPRRGFCSAIESLCTMDAKCRGFARAFLSAFPERLDFGDQRQRAESAFADLVRRAKEAGELRPEFGWDDLNLLLMANAGLTHPDLDARHAASRKLDHYLLRAFRTRTTSGS